MAVTTSSLDTPLSPRKNADQLAWIWRAFNKIYCISLAHRPDRYERARAEFARVGLLDLVEFIIVDKHPTDSECGIYESHLACLRAVSRPALRKLSFSKTTLSSSAFPPSAFRRAVRFMESGTDWAAFFFGCFVNSAKKTAFRSVVKIKYRCMAHGYAVTREFATRLVETEFRGVSYDDFLRSIAGDRFYALYPACAYQSDSPTDNDKLFHVDRARRMAGGLRRLQHFNELVNHWLIHIIIAHVLAAAAIIYLILHHGR